MPNCWTFQQLTGKGRRIDLAGHAGPLGRPRLGAVTKQETKIGQEEVYYDGNPSPTRNIAGPRFTPLELKGRWSDRYGGKGFALARYREMVQFVSEAQQVAVYWDDVLNVVGLIETFVGDPEARSDIPWSMRIAVDTDLLVDQTEPIPSQRTPKDFTQSCARALNPVVGALTDVPGMQGSIFDAIGGLVDSLNSAFGSLVNVADQIHDMANAPADLIRRFRCGLGQVRTALIILEDAYGDLTVGTALEARQLDDEQRLWTSQAAFSSTVAQVMAELAAADRSAVLAERGQFRALYVARTGDSWESISRQYYGDATRAGDIRSANGVGAGTPPVPGTFYRIPR